MLRDRERTTPLRGAAVPQTQTKVGNLTPVPYEECMCVPKDTTSLFFDPDPKTS